MENTIQLELLEIIATIKKFQDDYLPPKCVLHVDMCDRGGAVVGVHGCADHASGLNVKRLLGLGDATKANFNTDEPWHVLNCNINSEVSCSIFCRGLPPMCRIEEYEEEIPAEKVIQTGEKTIVKRTRICCGSEAQ